MFSILDNALSVNCFEAFDKFSAIEIPFLKPVSVIRAGTKLASNELRII